MADGLAVDYEELRAAARAAFTVADELAAIGHAAPLPGRDAYAWGLAAAADRFSARFGHLVRGLGRNADDAGEVLRVAAEAYEAEDLRAPDAFGRLGEALGDPGVAGAWSPQAWAPDAAWAPPGWDRPAG